MYYLQCQCRYTGQWDEIPGVVYGNLNQAMLGASMYARQKRTPIQVIDFYGNVLGTAMS